MLHRSHPKYRRTPFTPIEPLESRALFSTYFVASTGLDTNPGGIDSPFGTIQHAIDMAVHPGDTIEVRAGTYDEMLTLRHSGSRKGGVITLEAYPGEQVLLSGAGAVSDDVGFGNNMIQIINKSYLQISGFEIAYDSGAAIGDDAFGIRVQGAGSNITLSDNVIHDITGQVLPNSNGNNFGYAGAGIQVYGSSTSRAYTNIAIDGNTIYDCQPGDDETETLTVNGNVNHFQITNNVIHDCNNIGIGMIGGEADVFGKPHGTRNLPVARNGLCSHNTVYNIHANYGGGFADGVYVDGGRSITVSDNITYQNDLGLEVGAENPGYVASRVVVEDNLIYQNTQGGLLLGGYQANKGRVQHCTFINNTVDNDDTQNTGSGELLIQYASHNVIASNIFVASAGGLLMGSDGGGNFANRLDHNLYFVSGASGEFDWNGDSYNGLAQFQSATGQDRDSVFADPTFANAAAGDFHLSALSPALAAGSSTIGWYDPIDIQGMTRTLPPNMGAY